VIVAYCFSTFIICLILFIQNVLLPQNINQTNTHTHTQKETHIYIKLANKNSKMNFM